MQSRLGTLILPNQCRRQGPYPPYNTSDGLCRAYSVFARGQPNSAQIASAHFGRSYYRFWADFVFRTMSFNGKNHPLGIRLCFPSEYMVSTIGDFPSATTVFEMQCKPTTTRSSLQLTETTRTGRPQWTAMVLRPKTLSGIFRLNVSESRYNSVFLGMHQI